MKKTIIFLSLLSLSSAALAGQLLDEKLEFSRKSLRETISSLEKIQRGSNLDSFQKDSLSTFKNKLTGSYKSLELLSMQADEKVLAEKYGVKAVNTYDNTYVLESNEQIELFSRLPESEVSKVLGLIDEILVSIKNLNQRIDDDIRDFDYSLGRDLAKLAHREKRDVLNGVKKELSLLHKVRALRDDLADRFGLRTKMIRGEYHWDSELLRKKTGYSSFELMPEELRVTMSESLKTYMTELSILEIKFEYLTIVPSKESNFVISFMIFERK